MLEAAAWGLVAGVALLIGAGIGLRFSLPQWTIGLVMAFGVGALISAVAYELTAEAYARGGTDAVIVGLTLGALVFFVGDLAIDRRGGRHRKRSGGQQSEVGGAILLGAVLDGIPESVVIGISLLSGQAVGIAFVAAVAISNLPEAISATTGLRRTGWSPGRVLGLWAAVVIASALAAGAGYALLDSASPAVTGFIEAFAAGAVLTMLADTMMPEAFEEAGPAVGLATVLGYAIGALLTLV